MKHLLNNTLLTLATVASFTSYSAQIALENVNLIDVENLKLIPGQTILIEEDRIKRIASADSLKLKDDVLTVDLTGKYIIPGLIDGHVHHATDPDGWDNESDTLKRLQNLLRGGVTSVRDMGGDTRVLNHLARDAQLDVIQAPDIYYSVIIGGPEFFADPRTISSAKGHEAGTTPWMASVTDNTDLDSVMLKALGAGATGIKIYAKVPKHLVKKLSDTAKKHGLKAWSHVYIGPAKPSETVSAGVETLSHVPDLSAEIIEDYAKWRRQNQAPDAEQEKASYQASSYRSLLATMVDKGTILDATMTVFEQRKSLNENTKKRYQHTKMLTRLAHQQGVTISAGTDAFSDTEVKLYKELDLLVNDGGLSPIEAIQAGTINNAKVIGQEQQLGSIVVGKKANLVVLANNPIEDINNISSVDHVIKNGNFIYLGKDERLPFIPAKKIGNTLWMSGQIGNLPSTMTLASNTIEGQVEQTMKNIGAVLQEHQLTFNNITKCTLMLEDISEWAAASKVYKTFFPKELPTRSAFATSGLALGAKVEIECLASY